MWTLFFAAWVQMKDDLYNHWSKIRTLRLVFYQHATKFMICCLSVSILGQASFCKNSLCSTLRVKFNNYTLSQRSQLFRFLLLGQGTRYRGGGFHFNPDYLKQIMEYLTCWSLFNWLEPPTLTTWSDCWGEKEHNWIRITLKRISHYKRCDWKMCIHLQIYYMTLITYMCDYVCIYRYF